MTLHQQVNLIPWGNSSSILGRLEPITVIFLAFHGVLILQNFDATRAQWGLVLTTALLGVTGLAGWRSGPATKTRAWLVLAIAWTLLFLTGGVASFFTLWLFMLAAVYSLVLDGVVSAAIPVVASVSYVALVPIAEGRLPVAVLWGRSAAIAVIGLVIAGISAGQRRATLDVIEAKDEFIAAVSHELRTPLTIVVGFASELSERAAELNPDEIKEFARAVHQHSVEVANIVEDLLVAARADTGKVNVFVSVVELRAETDKIVSELTSTLHLAESHVTVHGPSVTAASDLTRLRQILRNLIINACRYGGPDVRVTVMSNDDRAIVEVSDNGIGVPNTDVPRLFVPYERLHKSTEHPASIGLGLTVSRTLARLMEGDLTYRRENGWTTFVLDLPSATKEEAAQVLGEKQD